LLDHPTTNYEIEHDPHLPHPFLELAHTVKQAILYELNCEQDSDHKHVEAMDKLIKKIETRLAEQTD